MSQEDIDKENAANDRARARDEARQKREREAELAEINERLKARGEDPVTYSK